MKRTKHSAPGPYLGFGLQTVRLCARLLVVPEDATVFVEHDDDVSVHYADGTRLLEQTKSVGTNVVGDWSIGLWKTISNWLEDHSPIAASNIKHLCLYVTPPSSGTFVKALHSAKTQADVEGLVTTVTSQVDDKRRLTKVYPYVKRFLDAPLEEQIALATRFELIAEINPVQAIRDGYALGVNAGLLDRVAAYAIGRAKTKTDALLAAKLGGGLIAGEFQADVRAFVQEINLPALFDFDLPLPTPQQVSEQLQCKPVFIRQLELIELEKEKQLNAVNDYLRASACKTQWSKDGVLMPGSLDQWNANLMGRHGAICEGLAAKHAGMDSITRGKAVYAECRLLDEQLQGKSVPVHFLHGSYNDLANEKRVGWHPDYLTLLD